MDIELFLPGYPVLFPDPNGIFSAYRREWKDVVQSKREFAELALDPFEAPSGGLLKHQEFIKRFLSGHTPYPSLLLWHDVGTGKTLSAIAVAENMRRMRGERALVLLRSPIFFDNFKNELEKYFPDYRPSAEAEDAARNRERNRLVSAHYELDTFRVFAKKVKKMGENHIRDLYSNRVIIVDEVHNLRSDDSNDEKEDTYGDIKRFLHTVENCKIVLLSATPIKNEVGEFADVMNLILPNDEFTDFKNYFRNDELVNKEEIVRRLEGRISYLRQAKTGLTVIQAGEIAGLPFPVVVLRASESQRIAYAAAFIKDQSLYNLSTEALLFTGKPDVGNDLEKLGECSAKYRYLVDLLLKNPGQKVFAYCRSVSGAGIETLKKILKPFGIKSAFVTGESTDADKILARYNSQENDKAGNIQLLVGSAVLGEGRSLLAVRHIVILTPWWNFTDTDQAIGRGIRFGSHALLPEGEQDVTIHRLLVDLPDSVDRKMYEHSYEKDRKNKLIEDLARNHAVDCTIFQKRNRYPDALDGSRECLYRECDYQCSNPNAGEPIFDTYNLFYSDEQFDLVRRFVQKSFSSRSRFSYHVQEWINDPDIALLSPLVVYRCLYHLVERYTEFRSPLGFVAYLKVSNDTFFLSHDMLGPADPSYEYDTRVAMIFPPADLDRIALERLPELIGAIRERLPGADRIADALPQSVKKSLLRHILQKKERTDLDRFFLERYEGMYEDGARKRVGTDVLANGRWEPADVAAEARETAERLNRLGDNATYGFTEKKQLVLTTVRDMANARSKGKVCTSYKIGELQKILESLGGRAAGEHPTREQLCEEIQRKLGETQRLVPIEIQKAMKGAKKK